MFRFVSLLTLGFLASSSFVNASSFNEEPSFNSPTCSYAKRNSVEDLRTKLKAQYDVDAEEIASSFPTLAQIKQEKENLFLEGRTKLEAATADPNKQFAIQNDIKTRLTEIEVKQHIAKLLGEYVNAKKGK
jgi:hypothetical protein